MNANEFVELSNKYKYFRQLFLQDQNYRFAFCCNEFLYTLFVHNKKYIFLEDLRDLKELRYSIFNEINENDIIFDIITQEIDFIFKNNKNSTVKQSKKQLDLLIPGIHVDMCQCLFYLSENDKAFEYINNALSLYLKKYNDNNHFCYQQLLMHFIGEVLCFRDINEAVKLYQEKIDECVFKQYAFSVTMLINITIQLIKNSYFDMAWIFLEKWFEIYKITDIENLSIDDKYLLYHYMRLNILVKEGKYEKGIAVYEGFTKKMNKKSIFYPWFCLEISNCFLELFQYTKFSKWIDEGYTSYSYLSKEGDIYFKILKQKSFLEFKKGNISFAIDCSKEALKGFKDLYGKNEDYVSVLIQLFIMIESDEKKGMYWNEIVTLLDKLTPYQQCLMYTNMVAVNHGLSGKFSLNFKELSSITNKAIEIADNIDDLQLKLISRLNHLRVLVVQYSQNRELESEICLLFDFFDKYFSKYEHKNGNSFYFLYYLCRLIFSDEKKDFKEVMEIDRELKNEILPYQTRENINIYNITYADLKITKEISEKDYINQQLDMLNDFQYKINNDNSMNIFISQVMRVTSIIDKMRKNIRINELFKYISKSKYLYANYYGNYIDNPDNLHIAKIITGLETRLKYQENISKKREEEIFRKLEQEKEKIEFDYFLDKKYTIPSFSDAQLPRNSCYLDYYFCYDFDIERYSFNSEEDMIKGAKFCVHFVENDQYGNLKVKRLGSIDAVELLNNISNFYEGDILAYDKIVDLLLRPVMRYISKYETIYISPDSFLVNFPFEILETEKYSMLKKHIIIYVYSIFDVKPDFNISTKKPLIMGNPKYSIAIKNNVKVSELPLTEIESRYIANLYNTEYFTKEKANKKNFLDNCDATFIHLSSHGFSDYMEIYDTNLLLTSSVIVLAGYNDWSYGAKKNDFDNGNITAQEISFLSMDNLDLVVLSACESGWENFDEVFSYKGLRWAFLYAGAKACITSLFEVDEALTAIFMMIFYDYLKKYPVAKALHKAKIKCMNLTLNDLMSNNIFRDILEKNKKYYNKEYYELYPFCEQYIIYSFLCTFKNSKK